MINHAVKGTLAKLLATEDLIIEHKKCDTASFDVHNRVLTLPLWQKATEEVYDLLVAHEVGHALYTPDEEISKQYKVPHQFVNVTEDARIEKLMKRRYLGLPKTFYRGYKQLQDDDFFSLEDDNVNEMNLADRVNLHFKIGSFLKINFTEKEQEIVDMVDAAETFQDALEAAVALWNYCKSPKKEEAVEPPTTNSQQQNNNGQVSESFDESGSQQEEGDDGESEEPKDGESYGGTSEQQSSAGGEHSEEPQVRTADSLSENVQNLSQNDSWGDPYYMEIPQVNLDTVVVDPEKIHSYIEGFWENEMELNGFSYQLMFSDIDKEFSSYKKDAQREVNYLVKEFECRKSADAYARTSVSKSGVLDTAKLHTYRYSEDIFKRISITKDGKSHGLVFVLDWSGSMNDQMMPTLKQLFNLVWFCKKTNIPFDVYAFSSEWNYRASSRFEDGNLIPQQHTEKKSGYFALPEMFNMLNILSSTTKTKDFDRHIRNMYRVAKTFEVYRTYKSTPYTLPARMSLSGTPLNEAIVSMHTIIPDFCKRSKTQKVHCVILTDGEACNSVRYVDIKRNYDDEEYVGVRSIGANGYVRCRKTGNNYPIGYQYWNLTSTLITNLKDCFPGMNMIGIRVLPNRDFRSWIKRMDLEYTEQEERTKIWSKEKSVTFSSTLGYDELIGLSCSSLESSSEFSVPEQATKAQILSSFKKSYGGKKTNKKILSKFISVIA